MIELLKKINPKWFPMIGIIVNILSASWYALFKNYAWSLYWILAAGLTFTATFLMDKR